MDSTWLDGGYQRFTAPPAESLPARVPPPMSEAYKKFAKSGLTLQYCQLPICYSTQPPLRFYQFTGSSSSPRRQAEQPKLRLATPYLDSMYQEQQKLKEHEAVSPDVAKNVTDVNHVVVVEDGKGEEVKEADDAEANEAIEDVRDADYVQDVDDDEDEDELEASRKRKKTPSRARCSNKQAKAAPTFEMCDNGTIVVRKGEEEILLPYEPNMVRRFMVGPRSPLEQARRDRQNAACRMSRARAKQGATRPYTFKKRATKSPKLKLDPPGVMDTEQNE